MWKTKNSWFIVDPVITYTLSLLCERVNVYLMEAQANSLCYKVATWVIIRCFVLLTRRFCFPERVLINYRQRDGVSMENRREFSATFIFFRDGG